MTSNAERRRQAHFQKAQQITWDGEIWNIIGIGAIDREAGKIWVHMASTTRFRQQKNGKVPVQILDQVPIEMI